MASGPLSAALLEIRERMSEATILTPALFAAIGMQDAPRLLAAVEAALKFHAEAVIEGAGPTYPFHYCSRCSGHPKWPCPEVRAILAALTGKEVPDA